MPPPLIGDWTVQVKAVRPFTIHGDLYYELLVAQPDQLESAITIRVPQHAVPSQPTPGDKLVLTFLMGQVTGARPDLS